MEIKELITPNTFSLYGYIAAVLYPICGTLLSAVTLSFKFKASEIRKFDCKVGSQNPLDKNYIEESCFIQYQQHYNSPLPLFGFTILSYSVLTLICIVYSRCCVKSRVEEVEQKCSNDPENPRPRQTIQTRKVFKCYLTQLIMRIILGPVFIILQRHVLYPSRFPTEFPCELNLKKSRSTEINMTTLTNSSFIDCKNSMGFDKDVLEKMVLMVNITLTSLAAGEVIYILIRARRKSYFMCDTEFCQKYLFNKRKNTRAEQFRMNRRIIEDTQVLEPLIPPEQGDNEGYRTLDDVYVNLVIHTRRSRCNLKSMKKPEIMQEYIKPPPNSIIINNLEELFLPNEDSSNPRKILILGCPGIGKSLLCTKLLRELSKKEEMPEEERKFHFKYLFRFRNLNSEELKRTSFRSLLSHGIFSEGKTDDETFQCIQDDHSRVLLVFDGLDEFEDRNKCLEDENYGNGVIDVMPMSALYAKLIKGRIISGATVLTTARPYAIESVERVRFDRVVEMMGFCPDKVQEYCTNFFRADESAMEKVLKHIKSNLNLLYLCYIPSTCFIVCSLLEIIIKRSVEVYLPSTLTDIYKGALKLFILKHHPDYQYKRIKRSDLSDVDFCTSVKETRKT